MKRFLTLLTISLLSNISLLKAGKIDIEEILKRNPVQAKQILNKRIMKLQGDSSTPDSDYNQARVDEASALGLAIQALDEREPQKKEVLENQAVEMFEKSRHTLDDLKSKFEIAKREESQTSTPSISKISYSKRYGDVLDYLEAYRVHELHRQGLTGTGYSVSILEANANPEHPALKGKIEIVNPFSDQLQTFDSHGNHVSGLIVGNEVDEFKGGVAPGAKGYLIGKESRKQTSKEEFSEDLLKAMRAAAERSHIINLSGGLTAKGPNQRLSKEFLESLKGILEENDSVLVITASNDTATIGQSTELNYLVDLMGDSDLMRRVLIVGNLAYKAEAELNKQKQELDVWEDKLLPLMEKFIEQEENLKNISHFQTDFENYLKKSNQRLLEFYNIPEIRQLFHANSQEDIWDKLDLSVKDIKAAVNKILKKSKRRGESEELKSYPDHENEEVLSRNIKAILRYLKRMPIKNYANDAEQFRILEDQLGETLESSDSSEAFNLYKGFFFTGWKDSSAFKETLQRIKENISEKKKDIPDDRYETGVVGSTRAGVVKDHFVMTYGKDILSAWEKGSYFKATGSSQAAPITTGLLILLHQYLNEHVKKETSWVDIISLAKSSARNIGDPDVFGRGMLDTTVLFPEILK